MLLFIIFNFVIQVKGQYEGETCIKDNMEGVCVNMMKCKTAIHDMKYLNIKPQICSYVNTDSIVCCLEERLYYEEQPVATTSVNRFDTTTEYVPPFNDYITTSNDGAQCVPLSSSMTAEKTGQKAWDKCIEYQEKLVYPCERGTALMGNYARAYKCKHKDQELIVGGDDAAKDEFPHMVSLGFPTNGNVTDTSSIEWDCGGTLLSEGFILTAGHCTYAVGFGPVSFARIGLLSLTDPIDSKRFYRIKNIIRHPGYKPPSKYNDIALLEVDRDMLLDQSAVPACLDVGSPDTFHALATGWGATQDSGEKADQLQKVVLERFSTAECLDMFPPRTRNLIKGFDERTQICYGDKHVSKDTCQGDSGGPLQINNKQIQCMYTVIGVISFGRKCGYVGEPAIYTRVSTYVPWIESIVWP